MSVNWYRQFIYLAGGIEHEGKAHLSNRVINEVIACNGPLGIKDCLGYRVKNFSEGIAIGGYAAIAEIQKTQNRKNIRPRLLTDAYWAYTTRVFRI